MSTFTEMWSAARPDRQSRGQPRRISCRDGSVSPSRRESRRATESCRSTLVLGLEAGGQSVRFVSSPGLAVLYYKGLKARDALGRSDRKSVV